MDGLPSGLHGLFEFLEALSPEDANGLYGNLPLARCLVRRLLPPLAQSFVLRLLFVGQKPFQDSVLRKWAEPGAAAQLAEALAAMQRLRVVVAVNALDGSSAAPKLMVLNKNIQAQLSRCLLDVEGAATATPTKPAALAPAVPSARELHEYAVACWELVLQLLITGKTPNGVAPSEEVMKIASELQLKEGGHLTTAGFRFVLDDRQQQLWALLLAFLRSAKATGQHLGPLKMAMALGEVRVGQQLDLEARQPMEQRFVRLLLDLGVLCCPRPKASAGPSPLIFATPGALALFREDARAALSRSIAGAAQLDLPPHLFADGCLRDLPCAAQASHEEHGIIVESNFKIYAYTSSKVHASLLGLFCRTVLWLPNLVVCHLVADKALEAMSRGIRVENIVRYLEGAAHPRAVKRAEDGSPIIPANVRGQLEVWESSRSRTLIHRAVLFEWDLGECSAEHFEGLRRCAEEGGYLLWAGHPSGGGGGGGGAAAALAEPPAAGFTLAVSEAGAAPFRALLQQHSRQLAAGAAKWEVQAPSRPPSSKHLCLSQPGDGARTKDEVASLCG